MGDGVKHWCEFVGWSPAQNTTEYTLRRLLPDNADAGVTALPATARVAPTPPPGFKQPQLSAAEGSRSTGTQSTTRWATLRSAVVQGAAWVDERLGGTLPRRLTLAVALLLLPVAIVLLCIG